MNKYAGLVDNPLILPTLLGVIKLYQSLNKNLSTQILKQYNILFSAAEDSVMKYDENFSLKGDGGIDIKVVSMLKLALLNLKRFNAILEDFQEVSQTAYSIYTELTKRKRFASNQIPLLEQSLKRMVNLYDMISDDQIFSEPNLRKLKTNCTKLSNFLEPHIEVANENLSFFFEDSASLIGDLNVALNSIDRKQPGMFIVSYQAMEMLEDLKSKIFI
jgi:hypothetical protein